MILQLFTDVNIVRLMFDQLSLVVQHKRQNKIINQTRKGFQFDKLLPSDCRC